MNFKLLRKSSNRVKTVFHVVDDSGDVRGSINVRAGEEADLLTAWHGSKQPETKPAVKAKLRPLTFGKSPQAVLRGC
jgi:hypothetical protein